MIHVYICGQVTRTVHQDASALTSGCQVRTNEELVLQLEMDVVSLLGVVLVETWVVLSGRSYGE